MFYLAGGKTFQPTFIFL